MGVLDKTEAEGRKLAQETLEGLRGHHCSICGCTRTPHCEGCAACPCTKHVFCSSCVKHSWWCLGDRCYCGCLLSKHDDHGQCGCPPHIVKDAERQRTYLEWCNCSDEQRAARRAFGVSILWDFAFGVGLFDEWGDT